jgi:hypothetical protein
VSSRRGKKLTEWRKRKLKSRCAKLLHPLHSSEGLEADFIFVVLQAEKAKQAALQQADKVARGDTGDNGALEDDSNEEVDPTLYFENRLKALEIKKGKGINPYPHKFHVSMSMPDFVQKFKSLEAGEQLTDVTLSLAGI